MPLMDHLSVVASRFTTELQKTAAKMQQIRATFDKPPAEGCQCPPPVGASPVLPEHPTLRAFLACAAGLFMLLVIAGVAGSIAFGGHWEELQAERDRRQRRRAAAAQQLLRTRCCRGFEPVVTADNNDSSDNNGRGVISSVSTNNHSNSDVTPTPAGNIDAGRGEEGWERVEAPSRVYIV
ncbi:hypothetical protein BX600DRAFT_195565 [Xylariales sp. PMI_506]|nr:hypothetical protein BX600DRAFT_195565 [Xylariales sp. PMI_506]